MITLSVTGASSTGRFFTSLRSKFCTLVAFLRGYRFAGKDFNEKRRLSLDCQRTFLPKDASQIKLGKSGSCPNKRNLMLTR